MNKNLIQFTLRVAINKRLREFNFRKRSDTRYDVNVADERGERYYFTLIKETAGWCMAEQQVAAWIKIGEEAIIAALVEAETSEV